MANVPQPETINLTVELDEDGTPFEETVLVEPLGGSRYRVLASPGLLEGFAAGDEIELDPAARGGFHVTRRGGNICVQLFLTGEFERCREELVPRVEALGGWLDGEVPGLLVFTIPEAAGFPAIEPIFYDCERRYPDARWMYGNVYPPGE